MKTISIVLLVLLASPLGAAAENEPLPDRIPDEKPLKIETKDGAHFLRLWDHFMVNTPKQMTEITDAIGVYGQDNGKRLNRAINRQLKEMAQMNEKQVEVSSVLGTFRIEFRGHNNNGLVRRLAFNVEHGYKGWRSNMSAKAETVEPNGDMVIRRLNHGYRRKDGSLAPGFLYVEHEFVRDKPTGLLRALIKQRGSEAEVSVYNNPHSKDRPLSTNLSRELTGGSKTISYRHTDEPASRRPSYVLIKRHKKDLSSIRVDLGKFHRRRTRK